MTLPRRVIKVGGSLFDLPDLPQRLGRWAECQSSASHVWIAGGGPFCELLRRADTTFRLGEATSHWLCVRALHTTAGLLAAMLGAEEIDRWTALQEQLLRSPHDRREIVFDVSGFLRDEEPQLAGRPLPHHWQVTTDTIAARVAEALAADELVLLKSCDAAAANLEQLAATGYVDAEFPRAAAACRRIRCVNLRGSGKEIAFPSE